MLSRRKKPLVTCFLLAMAAAHAGAAPSFGQALSLQGLAAGSPDAREAYAAFAAGDIEAMERHAINGMESDPSNAVHYLLAGMAYTRKYNARAAVRMFNRAEELNPALAPMILAERRGGWALMSAQGTRLLTRGDSESALRIWTDASLLDPEAHQTHIHSAIVKLENAYFSLERALEAIERKLRVGDVGPEETERLRALASMTRVHMRTIEFINAEQEGMRPPPASARSTSRKGIAAVAAAAAALLLVAGFAVSR